MIASGGFSKPNKFYERTRRSNRYDAGGQRPAKKSRLVKYEYTTDILDNLIAVRHYTLLDRLNSRHEQHCDHRFTEQHSSSLDHSSSLPSIRSYYAIPDVRKLNSLNLILI